MLLYIYSLPIPLGFHSTFHFPLLLSMLFITAVFTFDRPFPFIQEDIISYADLLEFSSPKKAVDYCEKNKTGKYILDVLCSCKGFLSIDEESFLYCKDECFGEEEFPGRNVLKLCKTDELVQLRHEAEEGLKKLELGLAEPSKSGRAACRERVSSPL